jgi:hypothetical protein
LNDSSIQKGLHNLFEVDNVQHSHFRTFDHPIYEEKDISSVISYINETLHEVGFPAVTISASMSVAERLNITNCLYQLLLDRQRNQLKSDDLASKYQKSLEECNMVKEKIVSMKEDVEDAEKKALQTEMKKRIAEKEYLEKEKKYKLKISSLEKANIMIQHRDNQYRHEIRKREKSFNEIQEKLVKSLALKNKESWTGMDILNNLQGPKTNWNKGVSKGEAELLQHTIHSYQQKLDEISSENAELRQLLKNLEVEVQQAIYDPCKLLTTRFRTAELNNNEHISTSFPHLQCQEHLMSPTSADKALDEFSPCQFDMPFGFVKSQIEDGMRADYFA